MALGTLLDERSEAGDRLWVRFSGVPQERATARHQRQVDGVTVALWDLVNRGLLSVYDGPEGAAYVLGQDASTHVLRDMLRLPAVEASLIYRAGADWAAASTSRNIRASAASSSGSIRRAKRA